MKRYDENPFLENLPFFDKKKSVRIHPLGKTDDVLINQKTGEVRGTHVITYKKADKEQFVKVFANHIALTFDLRAAGLRAFVILMWAVQNRCMGIDRVVLEQSTLEDWCKLHPKNQIKIAYFRRGLAELVDAKIIAMSTRRGDYFINPAFIFNGDRIAFTTMLERVDDGSDKQMQLDFS